MTKGLREAPSAYAGESTSLLLDTHILLWLVGEPDKLRSETLDLLRAAGRARRLQVSVITVWEISLLMSKRKVSLPTPARQWLNQVIDRPDFAVVPLTPAIAIESNELPRGLPGDPVDRILVATARVEGLPLVTRDRLLLGYAEQGHLKAITA